MRLSLFFTKGQNTDQRSHHSCFLQLLNSKMRCCFWRYLKTSTWSRFDIYILQIIITSSFWLLYKDLCCPINIHDMIYISWVMLKTIIQRYLCKICKLNNSSSMAKKGIKQMSLISFLRKNSDRKNLNILF